MNAFFGFITSLSIHESALLIIGVCVFFAICFVCTLIGIKLGRFGSERRIKQERRDAVKRSKSAVTGQVSEQLAPFLPDFPCNPADVRFIGKPVDFIGFCGNPDTGLVDEIVFIEVKSGTGSLSSRERSVRQAIENGRIRYIEYRIG